MIGALALALVVGGGGIAGIHYTSAPAPAAASAAVNDLQILDNNEQAFHQLDELQQDENTPEDNSVDYNDTITPMAPPAS